MLNTAARLMQKTPFSRLLLVIAALLTLLLIGTQPAKAKYASLVIDAETGRVLHSINADTRNYPASLTKMMTLYKIFQRLETGQWRMDTRLKASARAARQPASKLNIGAGQTITVRDAILALIIKSANDVAVVVAENHSGTERNFARSMTATAKQIGMSRTNFRNASGLPHRSQLSTARDMAKLARALYFDFPQYYPYFGRTHFIYKGTTFRSHNKLLKSYKGADGVKTGYIRASGFNLVSSVERNGRRIIGVVFGGKSGKQRNSHMTKLLNKGFAKINNGSIGTWTAKVERKAPVKQRAKQVASRPTAKQSPAKQSPVSTQTASTQTASTQTRWGVQVGAFADYDRARRVAVDAFRKAPGYLRNGSIHVIPLKKKSGKLLHRARILGLSKREAYRACKHLERRKFHCMELKVPASGQLAAVGNKG